jgi:outer membrane protein
MRSKSRHLTTGLVLLIATAALAAPAVAQEAPGQLRVAVIDVTRLVTDSVAGKEVLESLQKLSESKSADLKVLADELEGLRGQINDGRLSLSEARISELERQLEDRSIAFRRARDDADRQLKELQAQRFADIERRVMPIINEVGQRNGYTMIFNKFESGLVFAQDSIDITDEILRSFDAAVQSGQEAESGTAQGEGR